jgi:hypothetical protein
MGKGKRAQHGGIRARGFSRGPPVRRPPIRCSSWAQAQAGSSAADRAAMAGSRRISLGHALIGVGLLLRRATTPVAALLLVLVAGGALLAVLLPGGVYLEALSIAPSIAPSGPVGAVLQGLVLVALVWCAGRVLAVLTAGLGWSLFPAPHRALLSRVSVRASAER